MSNRSFRDPNRRVNNVDNSNPTNLILHNHQLLTNNQLESTERGREETLSRDKIPKNMIELIISLLSLFLNIGNFLRVSIKTNKE